MEKILAIQSVDKKIRRQMSVLIGNYEFYYAAGAFSALFGITLDPKMDPVSLKKVIDGTIENASLPANEPEPERMAGDSDDIEDQKGYLVYLMNRYEITDPYDDTMVELFSDGFNNWSNK